MIKRFDPVEGRNADIIESVMACDEVVALPEDLQFKIRLCTEEVEENILCYSGSKWVEVSVDKTEEHVRLCFRDGGMKFDPLAKDDPDINAPIESRAVGGLGIFLCKQMMDSLDYHYENGCNIFSMKKNLN